MNIFSPTQHGYMDYLTVTLFLFAPIIGLNGLPMIICYALAGIHLALTLITDFPLGAAKLLPFKIHGKIERTVGPVLMLLPFALNFSADARNFYLVIGGFIVLLWFCTDYRRSE